MSLQRDSLWAPNISKLGNNWREILAKQPLAVVFFWAVWSPPDRELSAVVEKVRSEFEQRITFYAANVDDEVTWQLASKISVMSTPTLAFFQFGVVQKISIGYRSEEDLRKLLSNCLKS